MVVQALTPHVWIDAFPRRLQKCTGFSLFPLLGRRSFRKLTHRTLLSPIGPPLGFDPKLGLFLIAIFTFNLPWRVVFPYIIFLVSPCSGISLVSGVNIFFHCTTIHFPNVLLFFEASLAVDPPNQGYSLFSAESQCPQRFNDPFFSLP